MENTKTKSDKSKTIPKELRKDLEWIELCAYIEKNIFDYSPDQKLQKSACLVLSGLRKGQNVANNNCETYGDYPIEVILLTFKANKSKIVNAIQNKTFDSERNKMSYICAIVRDKLNDMYDRWKSAKRVAKKTEQISSDVFEHEGAEYKVKDNDNNKLEDKFKDLW